MRLQIDYSPAIEPLRNGKSVVLPTDTIYGLVCSALQPEAVSQMYKIRQRPSSKVSIILIADTADLAAFDVNLTNVQQKHLVSIWPASISVILPCPHEKWQYLHPGQDERSFRLPNNDSLRNLIRQTGPLLAPSANLEGQPPAITVNEAQAYFGAQVSVYIDGGVISGSPSRVIKLLPDGTEQVIRA